MTALIPSGTAGAPATVIVFGNEKGGSGKSTAAVHVTIGLLRQGFSVASLDLDARQGTFSRYLDNRRGFAERTGQKLPMPGHWRLEPREAITEDGAELTRDALLTAASDTDFVIIDTPGADTPASRYAHAQADLLITPINDSLIDLDLLAKVDPISRTVRGASLYAETVWDQRKARYGRDGGSIDWIVMRNRLGHTDARNKRDVAQLLETLSRRIGFRLAPGFGERVIFRELFLQGLTLLDLKTVDEGPALTMSHVAARQEVRGLLDAIDPETLRQTAQTIATDSRRRA